jgi:(E)-4-hydroxy-3-methylbut-2-enyl-diphosphate synthase
LFGKEALSKDKVRIGGFGHVKQVIIGGAHPVVIQTMWKERLSFSDLEYSKSSGKAVPSIVKRIAALSAMGCGLLRFAVPDIREAEILGEIASMVSMPLCADIHFDYKIALRCLDYPIAKLRINPGNIGSRARVEAVLSKAAAKGVPVRIGVNAGSLPLHLREKPGSGGMDRAEALVEAALEELAVFTECGFDAALVSMKASGIADTIRANRLFRARSAVPLHIGVTEAGPLVAGTVRSAAALVPLLADGIGDTLRVSLSDSVENEVIAGREILNAVRDIARGQESAGRNVRGGAVIVSCPRCGRCAFDTHAFTARWMERLYALEKDCTVAVMGCAVNGPGEAKHADLGITGAGNSVLIFRHGKVIRTITSEEADSVFGEELAKL